MAMISGGQVISGGVVMPDTKDHMLFVENAVPTDLNVGVPAANLANGQLAQNVTTGFIYERQAGVWVRVDTITPHPR